jgi:hypothetical protein
MLLLFRSFPVREHDIDFCAFSLTGLECIFKSVKKSFHGLTASAAKSAWAMVHIVPFARLINLHTNILFRRERGKNHGKNYFRVIT